MSISAAEVARFRAQRAQLVIPENAAGGSDKSNEVGRYNVEVGANNVKVATEVISFATPPGSPRAVDADTLHNESAPKSPARNFVKGILGAVVNEGVHRDESLEAHREEKKLME
jgi:hypothetical protein